MTVSWLPVVWVDILGSLTVLILAILSARHGLGLRKRGQQQSFFYYLALLTLVFVLFAVSRSFGHLVKQFLYASGRHGLWEVMAPLSGAVNTVLFVIVFSFGVYFERSRMIHQELERHRSNLADLVADRTRKLTESNRLLSQEIEERICTEKKLEQKIREFSAVMDGIDHGVLFLDEALKTRIGNRAFCEIWGMDSAFVAGHPSLRELLEWNRYNHVYPVSDEAFTTYVDERVSQVKKGAIAPELLCLKSGKTLQYRCVALDAGWRMLTYFDVTEMKKTEEKLLKSQKMEAMGMMAGGVAHDLNNILSAIVGYPDLLLMELPEKSALRQPLEVIKSAGQRAADVVADMLLVARGAASSREVIALNSLVLEFLTSPEVKEMLSIHQDVRLSTKLAPKLSNISCSSSHIQKCLMNLLNNGAEAIEGQGRVVVATRNQYVDKAVAEDQSMDIGEYVVLRVSDTGKGIAEEDVDEIFEPFFSKKVLGRSGTGLGLAIVWNTIREYGGSITVASGTTGTVFELFFPVSLEEVQEIEGEMASLQGHGERILIVDDEQQQRDLGVQILLLLGYEAEAVVSGEEALALVQERAMDLLVLDMIMDPGMNGRETYEAIVKISPSQRALIASGFSENDEVLKTQGLGAGEFIRKPYTVEQLGRAVQKALHPNGGQEL